MLAGRIAPSALPAPGQARRAGDAAPALLGLMHPKPAAGVAAPPPAELAAAQAALRLAVALCQRHSRDAAPAAAQALWFDVLQVSCRELQGVCGARSVCGRGRTGALVGRAAGGLP